MGVDDAAIALLIIAFDGCAAASLGIAQDRQVLAAPTDQLWVAPVNLVARADRNQGKGVAAAGGAALAVERRLEPTTVPGDRIDDFTGRFLDGSTLAAIGRTALLGRLQKRTAAAGGIGRRLEHPVGHRQSALV